MSLDVLGVAVVDVGALEISLGEKMEQKVKRIDKTKERRTGSYFMARSAYNLKRL